MDISDQLTCLFTADVEEQDQSYVVEVPKQEVDVGYVDPTEDYHVAVLSRNRARPHSQLPYRPVTIPHNNQISINHQSALARPGSSRSQNWAIRRRAHTCRAWIRGNNSETEVGERVRIRIETVHETVAFGEVVKRYRY